MGDNRFRLTCNYLNITDGDLQQLKDTFDYNSFDRTPGTLYKITEWIRNPPFQLVRNHRENVSGDLLNAILNQKLIQWHLEVLTQQRAQGDPEPQAPSVFDSLLAFARKIGLVAQYLVAKSIRAKDCYKQCHKWTSNIPIIKAQVSSMLIGQTSRADVYNLASQLIQARNQSSALYNTYTNFTHQNLEQFVSSVM